jgi:redox-sensitive bicupin YhaK (pirin superfamily)
LDIRLRKGISLSHTIPKGYTSFCYCIAGTGEFDNTKIEKAQLVLFQESGSIIVRAIEDIHYIFVTGKQLNEPIAWGGPIVMNTQEELRLAFKEYEQGNFIKHPVPEI